LRNILLPQEPWTTEQSRRRIEAVKVENEIDDELMSAAEVATKFRLSQRTLWRMAGEGRLPKPVKVGGLTRWIRSEVRATLEKARTYRRL